MSRTILMLEHDEDDRYITQTVFDENHFDIKLQFVTTSDELYAHLMVCDKNNLRYPSLILLNYHASPSTASEIINTLKSKATYQHIPVVVLSGSVHEDIIRECYSAGASSFIQKPARSNDTNAKISSFFNYWFKTVELP
jgi:response regulator RpfG family c-di-GMP phosphodiesterase